MTLSELNLSEEVGILLEGPDCTGKTTLAKRIVSQCVDEKRNVVYIHNGPFQNPEDAFNTYTEQLDIIDFAPEYMEESLILYDRGFASEMVYGPAYRQLHTPQHLVDRYVNRFKQNCCIIWCQIHIDFNIRIWNQRKNAEMVKDQKVFEEIVKSFTQLRKHLEREYSGLRIYDYDFTKGE